MRAYCLVELDSGAVADVSLRALTFARGLGPVAAVVFASPSDVPAADLAAYGVTDVYAVAIDCYAPYVWAWAIANLVPGVLSYHGEVSADTPSLVLAAGTDRGNEVLAHLGAITGLPMAANCVDATLSGCSLELTRQRWAGLLLEDSSLDLDGWFLNGPVAFLTVATDTVAAVPADAPGPVTVHEVTPDVSDRDLRLRADEAPSAAGGASLATARVVVGGGRGVGSADGFAPLEELAELLGGVVGVSRVVTSEGWRPHAQQVGQTGTKITPDLYLACGISGAIQHIAGCSGARNIIAINTDPAAPMMSRADYAVIGDLHEVLPALIAALRARS
jgi:electron transfer flavoprotein alpha subunit